MCIRDRCYFDVLIKEFINPNKDESTYPRGISYDKRLEFIPVILSNPNLGRRVAERAGFEPAVR